MPDVQESEQRLLEGENMKNLALAILIVATIFLMVMLFAGLMPVGY